jgi:Flagellar transcriptional activator (FlhC)
MRTSENRYAKDQRRRELAALMIANEARTQTIVDWTGLSRYQIQTMFREYDEFSGHPRHRGVSPFQPAFFSKSLQHECESAALAAVELEMSIILPSPTLSAAKSLPGLARGERLLNAFGLFRVLVPDARISLEHAVLLASELTIARTLTLRRCAQCDGLMVVDLLGPVHADCAFCRLDSRDTAEHGQAE